MSQVSFGGFPVVTSIHPLFVKTVSNGWIAEWIRMDWFGSDGCFRSLAQTTLGWKIVQVFLLDDWRNTFIAPIKQINVFLYFHWCYYWMRHLLHCTITASKMLELKIYSVICSQAALQSHSCILVHIYKLLSVYCNYSVQLKAWLMQSVTDMSFTPSPAFIWQTA